MKKIFLISLVILIIYLAVLFISWVASVITKTQLTSFSLKGGIVIVTLMVVGLLITLIGKK
jgi:hypothetical protein